MKIVGSGPARSTRPVSASAVRRAYQSGSAVAEPRAIADSAEVMGIPAAELSPKVQAAIMTLMEEVDLLRRDLDQTRHRLAEAEKLADQDTLVPVANRRAFVRELSRVLSFSERYAAPASLVYFDVNGFKAVNDSHGHAAGDAALLHIADVLVRNVRESDIVGRLGGDEFGVVLVHADEAVAAEKAVSLARAIGGDPLTWQGHSLPIAVSYGVYPFKPGIGASEALAEADRAMYAHKNANRPAED